MAEEFFLEKQRNHKEKARRRQFETTTSVTLLAIRYAAETMTQSYFRLKETDLEDKNFQIQHQIYSDLYDSVMHELNFRRLLTKDAKAFFMASLEYDRKHFPNDDLGVDETNAPIAE